MKRQKNYFKLISLVMFLQLTFVFPQGLHAEDENEQIVIGFSFGTYREERWLRDRDLFVKRAKELGAEVNVMFANSDAELQTSQAENLILQGVNVLVVLPQDAETSAKIVEMAHAEGIKVVAYDRMIRNCDLDFYVSFDNVKVGEMQAQGVLAVVNKGDFAYIGGSPKDNNAFLLKEGTYKILQPLIDNGSINIVLDQFSEDWKPDEAYKHLKAYLDEHKEIDGVICANDGTAFGAIQALRAFDLMGKVPVSGQDAELPACQRVVEGSQTITVYKPIRLLAGKAAEIAVSLAAKGSPEANNHVNNGKMDVPSYLIAPISVTKDNMEDTVIKDGFHSREDVYANISGAN